MLQTLDLRNIDFINTVTSFGGPGGSQGFASPGLAEVYVDDPTWAQTNWPTASYHWSKVGVIGSGLYAATVTTNFCTSPGTNCIPAI